MSPLSPTIFAAMFDLQKNVLHTIMSGEGLEDALFVCCVKGRPHDTDRLWLICTQWRASFDKEQGQRDFLLALFADDHLCKTFGFNNCSTNAELANLFCLYRKLLLNVTSSDLRYHTGWVRGDGSRRRLHISLVVVLAQVHSDGLISP